MPFILDRLDEDHEVIDDVIAFLRTQPLLRESTDVGLNVTDNRRVGGRRAPRRFLLVERAELRAYLARYDPDRTRWDANARHNIAYEHRETEGRVCGVCIDIVDGHPQPVGYPCLTLRMLAWPYGNHYEHDDAWHAETGYTSE